MSNLVRQMLCLVLCSSMMACATAGTPRVAPSAAVPQGTASRSALVDYVQKLSPGTLVRVNRVQGHSVHGTLLKATDQSIFVQPKTRLPEAIVEIPVDQVLAVTPESKHGNEPCRTR